MDPIYLVSKSSTCIPGDRRRTGDSVRLDAHGPGRSDKSLERSVSEWLMDVVLVFEMKESNEAWEKTNGGSISAHTLLTILR